MTLPLAEGLPTWSAIRIALLVLAAALIAAPSASAGIIIEFPARKVCVGYDGGGIRLSAALNRGDRPSRRFWYRVRLYNPAGRLIYSDRSHISVASWTDIMRVTPHRVGEYRTIFEAYGWQRRVFRTRVFAC